ncbi:hypothetical protein PDJAM_G00001720 [Pangasius djambal]|uniref:Uncharacterized protein n=1 Tax=Pangasius djambal TaxID=1691987 RepID=A0ACC5XXW2_9TELE|nr:hypothetical protein [Pangasius djambal]
MSQYPLLSSVLSLSSFLLMKMPWQGAQTSIYCAVTEGLEDKSGCYFNDCAEKEPAPEAKDDEVAQRLWNESTRLDISVICTCFQYCKDMMFFLHQIKLFGF